MTDFYVASVGNGPARPIVRSDGDINSGGNADVIGSVTLRPDPDAPTRSSVTWSRHARLGGAVDQVDGHLRHLRRDTQLSLDGAMLEAAVGAPDAGFGFSEASVSFSHERPAFMWLNPGRSPAGASVCADAGSSWPSHTDGAAVAATAYCLPCGRLHFCTPACPANGCLAGLCVRLVEGGVDWGCRKLGACRGGAPSGGRNRVTLVVLLAP